MKRLIEVALAYALDSLPIRLRDAAGTVKSLVDRLDLPDDDPAWAQVGEYAADVLQDIRDARDLTRDEQRAVRLAAESRFHQHLRDMHLIERG